MWTLICLIGTFSAFVSGYLIGKTAISADKTAAPPIDGAMQEPDEEQAAFECLLRYNAETAYGTAARGNDD